MNRYCQDSVELLRSMVRIPSESFHEEEVAALLYDRLNSWNLAPRRIGNNVVASCLHFDRSLPTLVLDAHMDTVAPAAGYSRDPYDPGTDEDTVYGLGSNDDGGSAVAMIAAFRHFYNKVLPINIVLALSCEEERSGPRGARLLYGPDGPEEVRDARWVIIGEPTGMKAATSERGLLVLDAVAEGVSGHAARNEGVNALYIAMEDIAALRAHKFSRISRIMGEVGLNVTQICAGTAHNVIPDRCSFVVDIRPTEQYTNEEILEELQALCRSRLTPRNLANRSSATHPDSPLLRTLADLGIGTFSSPTTSNWMRTGKDAIKMGPGESSRSHHADEYILCEEISDSIKKYINFVENFYGHTLE
ncbi:MAG: M20/M25/M40 family metallo-hydrolase [Bacteroidales bacterium]|nr:M20/M25/M40 family metallo-hydrolase [Bacteroidales bacterium]